MSAMPTPKRELRPSAPTEALLHRLYHAPADATELSEEQGRPDEVANLLDELAADQLITPIQKNGSPTIFALTRKGERLLEGWTLQRYLAAH